MKRKLTLILITIVSVLWIGCVEDNPAEILDKEIRLAFPFEYWYSEDSVYTLPYVFTYLKNFDKSNYAHLDSIFFICTMSTDTSIHTAHARLFDVTNGISIIGSELTKSTNGSFMHEWVISENLIDKLPDGNIDLAIQLKVDQGFSYLRGAYLKLKRN